VRHLKYEDTSDTRSVELGGDQVHLALVADGHGGGEASRYAAAHLLDHFVEAAAGDGSAGSLRCAGELACARVHRELLSLKPATAAGSTITVVAFNATRSQLTTINLGDSDAWAIFKGTQVRIGGGSGV
jgi:protein phosphatase 1K